MILIVCIFVILAATAAVWHGSFLLENAAGRLAAHYHLPAVVQGSIIMAVGSSFPELSSTVIATLVHGKFELGVAAVVGSAVFNILVIPGISGLVGRGLETDREMVYKEALFYMISVAVLMLSFALALIYYPVAGSQWEGSITRPLALLPVGFYGLYIFLQHQDTMEYRIQQRENGLHAQKIQGGAGRLWLRLVLGLAFIGIGVEGLVRSVIILGDVFKTPHFFWGLSVIAAATSLPDAFVSIQAARRQDGVVSMANVLGSNTFDLLIAIPVGVLIAGTCIIDFSVAAPAMGLLAVATIALFVMLRTQLRLTQFECILLLVLYAGFLAWMGVDAFFYA
jgi:cation:H+ antiporter